MNTTKQCAECTHETDKCVKIASTQTADTICLESNDDRDKQEAIARLLAQNAFYRRALQVLSWTTLILCIALIITIIF